MKASECGWGTQRQGWGGEQLSPSSLKNRFVRDRNPLPGWYPLPLCNQIGIKDSQKPRVGRDLRDRYLQLSHYTDGRAKAQRWEVILSGSPWSWAELTPRATPSPFPEVPAPVTMGPTLPQGIWIPGSHFPIHSKASVLFRSTCNESTFHLIDIFNCAFDVH